jgi:hypothetical protein
MRRVRPPTRSWSECSCSSSTRSLGRRVLGQRKRYTVHSASARFSARSPVGSRTRCDASVGNASPALDSVPDGAIAQLGERLLCKQEVAGSIPAGSTREVPANRSVLGHPAKPVSPELDPNRRSLQQRRLRTAPTRRSPRNRSSHRPRCPCTTARIARVMSPTQPTAQEGTMNGADAMQPDVVTVS